MNYRECLFSAKKQMVERNLSENAAMLLMMEITGKENHDLYVEFEEEISEEILKEFNDGINLISDMLFGSQDYAVIARK